MISHQQPCNMTCDGSIWLVITHRDSQEFALIVLNNDFMSIKTSLANTTTMLTSIYKLNGSIVLWVNKLKMT